ncbi:MAG: DUF6675 family protein [Spirochaetia bacterium]
MTIFRGFAHIFIPAVVFILFAAPSPTAASDEAAPRRLATVEEGSAYISGMTLEEKAELYNTGSFHRFYFDAADSTRLYPDSDSSEELMERITGIKPNIGVEAVYLYPAEGIRANRETLTRLSDMLHRVSTLAGIEYYSNSRGHMRTFFRRFYPISEPENPKDLVGENVADPSPLPDPIPSGLPVNDTLYAFQEDLTFGEAVSRIEYHTGEGVLNLVIENLTDLHYKFIRLVKAGNMQIHLSLILLDDYILFYGNCAVKTFNLFGIAARKKESFLNRIDAMYSWFTRRYEAEILTDN